MGYRSHIIMTLFVILLLSCLVSGFNKESSKIIKEEGYDVTGLDPSAVMEAIFKKSPEKAWAVLKEDPILINDPKILEMALKDNLNGISNVLKENSNFALDRDFQKNFGLALSKNSKMLDSKENMQKFVGLLDKNPDLMESKVVLEHFDERVRGKDVSILNENPTVKAALFKTKFKVSMVDNKVEILHYDGINIKTGGENPTEFNPILFPNAIILPDGSIKYRNLKFSKTDEIKYSEKHGFEAKGGLLTIQDQNIKVPIKITDGSLIVKEGTSYETFSGTFTMEKKERGISFVGNIIKDSTTFEGEVFYPNQKRDKQDFSFGSNYILKGNSEFDGITKITSRDGTQMTVKGDNVYYTEATDYSKIKKFCRLDFSCIISPTGNKNVKQHISLLNVQNDDRVDIKSPAYLDRFQVNDQLNGLITFSTTDSRGKIMSTIKMSPDSNLVPGSIAVSNNLAMTKVGRVDVVRNKHDTCNDPACQKVLHHWSSLNNAKSVGNYFNNRKSNSFVECDLGINCERRFAESFGKIIGPKGQEPKATLIVAGDNAETHKKLENWCKTVGCYILSSRDVPSKSNSQSFVVTGHHYAGTGEIWREGPGGDASGHIPIDKMTFGKDQSSTLFNTLPDAPNLENIMFSSCNTAVEQKKGVFDNLYERYPNLRFVSGWKGTAPYYEYVDSPPDSMTDVNKVIKNGNKGTKAYYYRKDNYWYWTDGDKTEVIEKAKPIFNPIVKLINPKS